MTSGKIEVTRTYAGVPGGNMAIASDGTIYYTASYYTATAIIIKITPL